MHTTHSLANVTYSYLIIANLIGSYAVSKNKKFRKCAAHSVWTECTATGLIYKNKSRQYKLRRIQSGHLRRHPPGWYRRESAVQVLDAVGQHQEDAKVASLLDLVAPLLQDADGVGGEALL